MRVAYKKRTKTAHKSASARRLAPPLQAGGHRRADGAAGAAGAAGGVGSVAFPLSSRAHLVSAPVFYAFLKRKRGSAFIPPKILPKFETKLE